MFFIFVLVSANGDAAVIFFIISCVYVFSLSVVKSGFLLFRFLSRMSFKGEVFMSNLRTYIFEGIRENWEINRELDFGLQRQPG